MGRIIDRRRVMGGGKLPYDAEIEYLESTGTQYIDTGITPDSDTVANIGIRVYSVNTGIGYFGSRVVNGDRFQILDAIGIGQGYYKGPIYMANIDYKISLHGTGRVFINNTEVNASYRTFTPISSFNYSLYCFGANQGDRSILLGSCRVYSVLIKKNDIDVLDLIPVRVGQTGYMYDKVSGQLFGNAGTGSFILGPDRVKLPSGYTQLEYIQSTGTQYIDTEINGGNLITAEIKAVFSYGDNTKLFGYRINTTTARNIIIASQEYYYYLDYGNGSQINSGVTIDGNIHIFNLDKNKAYIDGVLRKTYETQTFTGGSMYLFACNQNGEVNGMTRAKIYYTKILDNDVIVRHLIPARRNSDNVLGMYDIVSGNFFTNAGTGDFIAGPEA